MWAFCLLLDRENGIIQHGDFLMDVESKEWAALSYEEKNHQLYLRQKAMLNSFLEHGAISQAQHDKSLHDLTEKMGERK